MIWRPLGATLLASVTAPYTGRNVVYLQLHNCKNTAFRIHTVICVCKNTDTSAQNTGTKWLQNGSDDWSKWKGACVNDKCTPCQTQYYWHTEEIIGTLIAFDRTHTIVHIPLIADARSFQALTAILGLLTHLASFLLGFRSDARQDEFRLKLLRISKVRGYDHVIKHQNTSNALFLSLFITRLKPVGKGAATGTSSSLAAEIPFFVDQRFRKLAPGKLLKDRDDQQWWSSWFDAAEPSE